MNQNTITATKVIAPENIKNTIAQICKFANIKYTTDIQQKHNADFIIISENNTQNETTFNIALITHINPNIKIESGGIAIIPNHIETQYTDLQTDTFQRILTYNKTQYHTTDNHIIIDTDWGQINIPKNQTDIAEHFLGIQITAAQIGIYEDTFYEFFLAQHNI